MDTPFPRKRGKDVHSHHTGRLRFLLCLITSATIIPPDPGGRPRPQSIGIDDACGKRKPGCVSDERERAEQFAARFRAVYLTFHRRDGPRSQLAGASRAVLEHLAIAGPLTVGEAAAHLSRAQSVVSEIVGHLQDQGLLERENDPADRRRTLIWLTPAGHDALRRDREVLGLDLLASAFARMPAGEADRAHRRAAGPRGHGGPPGHPFLRRQP